MKYWSIILVIILISCSVEPEIPMDPCGGIALSNTPKNLTMESLDGLPLNMNFYRGADFNSRPIVFFHQAGMNKMEYCSIADKFATEGFNCVAVDLRSGGSLNEFENETYKSAIGFDAPTEYIDAYQDILASIDIVYAKSEKKLILWGSSYSAGLAMAAAQEKSDKVQAVLAFSPGEYYGDEYILKEHINNLTKPVFITSSKKEANSDLAEIINALPSDKMPKGSYIQFIPKSAGAHGSKVLWEVSPYKDEYWPAVVQFIEAYD